MELLRVWPVRGCRCRCGRYGSTKIQDVKMRTTRLARLDLDRNGPCSIPLFCVNRFGLSEPEQVNVGFDAVIHIIYVGERPSELSDSRLTGLTMQCL